MSDPTTDNLLEEFTDGFAFDERVRQQLSHAKMNALANMFFGWALSGNFDPKQSAWYTGVAEGLLAEAELVGSDWNPPEPEKLGVIGVLGRLANDDPIHPEQTPRARAL